MPHTCCVPNCNYGYCSCTDKQKYAMFRFPKDAVMKNKWLSVISRKNWTITENTRVCSKHFEKKDFKESSTDKRVKRRQARETSQLHRLYLKPSAIPHIFPGLQSHYNIKTTELRATTASSSVRIEKENDRIQQQYEQLCTQDAIESLEVAGCISPLLQLFLYLLSTCIDMPHLLSLNQPISCFFRFFPSISSSVNPVYVFHPIHVPLLL